MKSGNSYNELFCLSCSSNADEGSSLDDNKWHSVAVRFQKNTITAWIDHTKVFTKKMEPSSIDMEWANTIALGGNGFTGEMRNVKIVEVEGDCTSTEKKRSWSIVKNNVFLRKDRPGCQKEYLSVLTA